MSIDSGDAPDLCVLWARVRPSDQEWVGVQISCYRYGSTEATPLHVDGIPHDVALSPDGSRVLWQAQTGIDSNGRYSKNYADTLSIAGLDHGHVTDVEHIRTEDEGSNSPPVWGCGQDGVVSALWSSDTQLILECTGANDQPGGLVVEDLAPTTGWMTRPARPLGDGSLEHAGAVVGDRLATLQRVDCPSQGLQPCPDDAVTVPIADGKELPEATPLVGRTVTFITGGQQAVLYVTDAFDKPTDDTQRIYLKHPDDQVGQLVSGLPAGIRLIVMQP